MSDVIKFQCPVCTAEHTRGFVDGVDTFRCFGCGYMGHGFHPDPATDRDCLAEHHANNALNAAVHVPLVPLGVDPLSCGH